MLAQPMTVTLEVFREDGIGEFYKFTTSPVGTVEEAMGEVRQKAADKGMVEGAHYRIWTIR